MNIIRLVKASTAIDRTETPSKGTGPKGTRQETDEKYLAFSLLTAQGLSPQKAAEQLGYSREYGCKLAARLKGQSQNLSLLSEPRIRKAHRVIDKLMSGKAFGDIESVRSSDALRAAEVVLDRAEPKAQDVRPPSFNYTVINVDLRPKAKSDPENPPIDVSAEVMSGNDMPEMVGLETSLNNKGNNGLPFDIKAITRHEDE